MDAIHNAWSKECSGRDRADWLDDGQPEPEPVIGSERVKDGYIAALMEIVKSTPTKDENFGRRTPVADINLRGEYGYIDDDCIDPPAMPRGEPIGPGHHQPRDLRNGYSCIARSVGKKELGSNADAAKAVRDEYDKLLMQGAWKMTGVKEWHDVRTQARALGEKIHVGRIFAICVEKGSELPWNHKDRKFKGRIVFMGNEVRDEYHEYAIFQDLSSSPAALEAAKALDAFGSFDGCCIMQADAKQAYVQATLKSK